ncbi:MAG: hypothetical protein VCE74_16420 [Alphaproteobacteria bacterium]
MSEIIQRKSATGRESGQFWGSVAEMNNQTGTALTIALAVLIALGGWQLVRTSDSYEIVGEVRGQLASINGTILSLRDDVKDVRTDLKDIRADFGGKLDGV